MGSRALGGRAGLMLSTTAPPSLPLQVAGLTEDVLTSVKATFAPLLQTLLAAPQPSGVAAEQHLACQEQLSELLALLPPGKGDINKRLKVDDRLNLVRNVGPRRVPSPRPCSCATTCLHHGLPQPLPLARSLPRIKGKAVKDALHVGKQSDQWPAGARAWLVDGCLPVVLRGGQGAQAAGVSITRLKAMLEEWVAAGESAGLERLAVLLGKARGAKAGDAAAIRMERGGGGHCEPGRPGDQRAPGRQWLSTAAGGGHGWRAHVREARLQCDDAPCRAPAAVAHPMRLAFSSSRCGPRGPAEAPQLPGPVLTAPSDA